MEVNNVVHKLRLLIKVKWMESICRRRWFFCLHHDRMKTLGHQIEATVPKVLQDQPADTETIQALLMRKLLE